MKKRRRHQPTNHPAFAEFLQILSRFRRHLDGEKPEAISAVKPLRSLSRDDPVHAKEAGREGVRTGKEDHVSTEFGKTDESWGSTLTTREQGL
jgi:hypothetical protein